MWCFVKTKEGQGSKKLAYI